MARITLHIEAGSLTDLADTISGLRYPSAFTTDISSDRPFPGANIHGLGPDEPNGLNPDYEPDAGARQDAEPGERTRFKRTRDEIARGLTVEQAKAERAGTTSASPAASGPSTEKSDPSKKTEPSSGETTVDPFAEPPTTPTASPTTSDASQGRALTLQDLRGAMSAYLAKNDDAGAMQSLMAAHFKTEEGEPVMRASQLQTKDYAAAIELLSA